MSGFLPLASVRDKLQGLFADVRSQRFFHDRLSVGLLVVAVAVNIANFVALGLQVRPTDNEVPTHFSSLVLFDALGPWYFPFLIALFGLCVSVVNSVFAYHCFSRSRLASFFLLVTSIVEGVFVFTISMAFGAIR